MVNNTAVNVSVSRISVLYIIYLGWIATCGEVAFEGINVYGFSMWRRPDFPQCSLHNTWESRLSEYSQQWFLFPFFHCCKNNNKKKMVLYNLMCSSIITGEQRIQKKGLGRLMCRCERSSWRPPKACTGPIYSSCTTLQVQKFHLPVSQSGQEWGFQLTLMKFLNL